MTQDGAWARKAGLDGSFVFLYTGTLALKHNPGLLADLAGRMQGRTVDGRPVRVVVQSQGPGADFLREQAAARGLEALVVRGFGPFSEIPAAMAAADVLVAVLEPDASAYSVPSKVLAYLCAGRPVLLAVPPGNLAARIVARESAGRRRLAGRPGGLRRCRRGAPRRCRSSGPDGPPRPRLRRTRVPHRRHRRPDGACLGGREREEV